MPLEKEDLEQIKSLFAESQAETQQKIEETLTQKLNASITGAISRVSKELRTDIGAVSDKYDGIEGTVKQTVEGMLKDLVPGSSEGQGDTLSGAKGNDGELSKIKTQIDSLKAALDAEKEKNQTLSGNFKKAQELAEAEKTRAAQMQVKSQFYDAVRDRVQNPEQFLSSIQQFGGVKLDGGNLVIERTDEWDNVSSVPILQKGDGGKDLVDHFLSQDQFSFHAVSRPGAGSGARLGASSSNGKEQPKYFGDNSNGGDIAQAMVSDGIEAVINDLLKTAG